MNMIAENGIAAHWRYKYLNKNQGDENMYSWLRDAVNYVEEKNEKHLIVNRTSQQFFDEQIYVFSPKENYLLSLVHGMTMRIQFIQILVIDVPEQ